MEHSVLFHAQIEQIAVSKILEVVAQTHLVLTMLLEVHVYLSLKAYLTLILAISATIVLEVVA
jgi:hypothetical protein